MFSLLKWSYSKRKWGARITLGLIVLFPSHLLKCKCYVLQGWPQTQEASRTSERRMLYYPFSSQWHLGRFRRFKCQYWSIRFYCASQYPLEVSVSVWLNALIWTKNLNWTFLRLLLQSLNTSCRSLGSGPQTSVAPGHFYVSLGSLC